MERFIYQSADAMGARFNAKSLQRSEVDANNERIHDRQDKRNQASGKMKRSGVFATKLRAG